MIAIGRNSPCPCGSGKKSKRCCYAGSSRGTAQKRSPAASEDELLAGLPGDERWFGYDATAPAEASPFSLPEQGLVCMAWEVNADDLTHLHAEGHVAFTVEAWAVSTGAHEATVVHGPFPTMDAAFDFARSECGAVRFLQAPVFDVDA